MIDLEQNREKAVLITVDTGVEDCDALLDELSELAKTAGADTVGRVVQKMDCPDSATFVGTGKLEEIKNFADYAEADLLIFDSELSPSQQRNIEKITNIRTIDRTLLILDIFGQRANSGEGRIQVELARYQYMLPRLSGQGKNLSRQGGIGMKRGAGESKLESDKRHIRRRITALKEQLSQIEARRENQRKRRKKNCLPTVAIVGYTNAGKSTLLNYLTDAGVLAKDMLFATLDPTARGLKLPGGQTVIFIDTVGLIRNSPTALWRHLNPPLRKRLRPMSFSTSVMPQAVRQTSICRLQRSFSSSLAVRDGRSFLCLIRSICARVNICSERARWPFRQKPARELKRCCSRWKTLFPKQG